MIKIIRGEQYVTEMKTGKVVFSHRKHIKKSFMNYGSDIVQDLSRVHQGNRSGRVYFI